jgi:hypothetical protein
MLDDYSPINDDFSSIFSTAFTETQSNKLIDECQIRNNNSVLYLLNSIVLSLTYFCKLNYMMICKYSYNDGLYMDSYIKRYKNFVESAIYLNEIFENLNVLVNYLYESLFKGCPGRPKFSIYRMMIIIWNREVNNRLTDLKNDKNLINTSLRTLRKLLTTDINKSYGLDVRINKSRSAPQDLFSYQKLNFQDCINFESLSDDESPLVKKINDHTQNYNFCNQSLGYSLGNLHSMESKLSVTEEVYCFDFQAKYFLEQ